MSRSKNLLKNNCARGGLTHWEVSCSGGDGFLCEDEPRGCKKINECTHIRENLGCWATSYEFCEKYQLVNLRANGIRDRRLDNKKPEIIVRDWYGARSDCGGEFKIEVQLLADDKKTVLDSWSFKDTKEAGTDWVKVRHVFKNYPSGVRFVKFQHGGKDTNWWAGHYGIKMTNCGLFVRQAGGRRRREVLPKLGQNLIENPCGNDGLNGWEIVKQGGNGFSVEKELGGCKPIRIVNLDASSECHWVTSYGECEKKQLIDLNKHGFTSEYLDDADLQIQISEWFGCRTDAGCKYWLNVRLLNNYMKEIGVRYYKDVKPAEGEWYKAELSFCDFAPEARYIEYTHGGQDTCFWAGHYGAKIACSSVMIVAEGSSDTESDGGN